MPERLLLGLMYWRLYVTQTLLSYLFDLEESNISRELRARLLPILQEALPTPWQETPLRLPTRANQSLSTQPSPDTPLQPEPQRKKRINTLQELLSAPPEIAEVLLDATEQAIPQPQDKLKRKHAYSGKQQDHTVKTRIVATPTTLLPVFGGLPGCLHAMRVLRASGVLRQLPPAVRVRLDKGYQGADRAYPDVAIQQPKKKRRNQDVTLWDRAYHHLLSVLRIPVEHHFARLKKWSCLAQVWRGKFDDHEAVFRVIAGLLNFRQTGKFDLMG